jgi:hypothetical protein
MLCPKRCLIWIGFKGNRKLPGTGRLAEVEYMASGLWEKENQGLDARVREDIPDTPQHVVPCHAIPSSASTEGFENIPAKQASVKRRLCTVDKS